ncbi:arginine--tRNA ligase [Pantoea rodasii]|uniref:Arginine--tRNA ligase n=1 Tax=Pantoea rodasii TaxID=1076549 RepID=A0A2M9W5T4_9GAMM|nr:arginine--tRNA ligase [Pantoea rodasii]PJZ02903.1 arginine--tRNA ligase [Pantoea rodasii]
MNIKAQLTQALHSALTTLGLDGAGKLQVRYAERPQFGDYQIDGVMALAKIVGCPPRQLAERIVGALELEAIANNVDIAGPGFINIFLNPEWITQQLEQAYRDPRLGIGKVTPQRIVVDYSAPNVAKEMHVGHLRSTIIGDAVVRTLEFLGHEVIRANHIGDWGTQFGMLIAWLEHSQQNATQPLELSDLEAFYREAKKRYEIDPAFSERARRYVVMLQQGDIWCLEMWRCLVDITMVQNQRNYDRLNVTLNEDSVMGESTYNPMLPEIVNDLLARGLATESEGATVVYLDEYKNKNGEPMGVIIRKKDGGYLYSTTDIACAKYRYDVLHADRMLYYIDSRQHLHLMQAWRIVRRAGYVPESVPMEHHMFGMMMGKDGKPFKTREGGTIKLSELLDEAFTRARALVAEKQPDLDDSALDALAEVIGIGAVKYADLSKKRTTDYVFDWDSMLSFEGNTAPYLQYAWSRIASLLKRIPLATDALDADIQLIAEDEAALCKQLLRFEEVVHTVAQDGYPHLLTSYLYELASIFSRFYERCPILNAASPALQQSRLKLALLTARTLQTGLTMLGIKTVERM